MKTIKSSKEITTLEVGDKVVFGTDTYKVTRLTTFKYILENCSGAKNNQIFRDLSLDPEKFITELGIHCDAKGWLFPLIRTLEALTVITAALLKEYEKQNSLPKTWEEFCARNTIKPNEYWIDTESICKHFEVEISRCPNVDKNICTSKEEAEAFLALMQLRQLRKAYVKDWEPDWTNCRTVKSSITCIGGELTILGTVTTHNSMSFPNSKLAEQFLTNFKDLLEIAKPLL